MPDERFIHRRDGLDDRLCQLSDFEFRVLAQYRLSADDCGVMPRTAAKVQAENYALAERPAHLITRALDRLVELGLLAAYEHQGRPYVCQLDWNDLQKIRHCRDSHLPMPPSDLLGRCSARTAALFQTRLRGRAEAAQQDSGTGSEQSPDDSGKVSEISPAPARGGDRAKRLTANGSLPSANSSGPSVFGFTLLGGEAWPLRQSDFDHWRQVYPRLDLLAECQSAESWLRANPGRAKTAKGMPRFLDGWFKRATRALPLTKSTAAPEARHAGIPAELLALCERAGLRDYDIAEWFTGVDCVREPGTVVLLVPEINQQLWIAKHFQAGLAEAAQMPVDVRSSAA